MLKARQVLYVKMIRMRKKSFHLFVSRPFANEEDGRFMVHHLKKLIRLKRVV